jgi:hypothetical protein
VALRDVLRGFAAETETEVLRLFDRWQGGGITEEQFVAATAAVIARANGRAITVAERSAAIQLSRLFRRQVAPSAEQVQDPRERLSESVTTLLAEVPDSATTPALLVASQRGRLARLARNEPLQRGVERLQVAFQRSGAGWIRSTGPDPCPLCDAWDDGDVRPASVTMPRHTNCSCVQSPARL